jgi:glutathione synthase/RimK-type ligase-like ATP-grasp enzyme
MGAPDVLLATSDEWRDFGEDEVPLLEALTTAGLRAAPAVWSDPGVDWASAKIVVMRYVFDYTQRLDDFLSWVDRISSVTRLHNPARLVRWNSHKAYLRELEQGGIPIIPTIWPEHGSRFELARALDERGWKEAVVKPAVGNGARGALRVTPDTLKEGQDHLDALLAEADAMIQPYLAATENPGERALIHIGGRFSHAIAKDQMLAGRPFSFDRTPSVEPDPRERNLAGRVLDLIPESPLLYARVDTIVDGETVRLMELEVIEPVLFFTKAPGSAARLAEEIARRL